MSPKSKVQSPKSESQKVEDCELRRPPPSGGTPNSELLPAPSPRPPAPVLQSYGRYGALGFEFGGAVVAGLFVGRYADDYFGTTPWLMVLGAVGGLAGAIYRLILVLEHLSRRGQNDRKN